jgi:hypothetical protein
MKFDVKTIIIVFFQQSTISEFDVNTHLQLAIKQSDLNE